MNKKIFFTVRKELKKIIDYGKTFSLLIQIRKKNYPD